MTLGDNIDTSDSCAFRPVARGAFGGGISTNERVADVTVCPADRLPLPLQAQPVRDLPDVVEAGELLLLAAEVPVEDRDGSWKEMTAAWA